MSSVEQEIAALERILSRLQSTTNESLPRVLSSLLPKLIPLSNQATLRTKVVEVITEALRRTKASGCKLNLEVFTPLIQHNQMPYACNFGFAFLDTVCDANNIENVNEETVLPFLHAVESYPLFSYQSNAVLYYCLLYISPVSKALRMINPIDKRGNLVSILGEYLMDFILLQSVPMESNVVGAVHPGLSDRRMTRFTFKKKQLQVVTLRTLKTNALEALLSDTFAKSCYSSTLPLIGLRDSDREVASKSVQVLNRLKELPLLDSGKTGQILSGILSSVFGISFNKELNNFERIDRTPLRSDVLISILEHLMRNIHLYQGVQPMLLIEISKSVLSLVHADDLCSEWVEFLSICLNSFPSLPSDDAALVPSLAAAVQRLVEKFAMTTSSTAMSLEQSNSLVKYRSNCFNLLQKLFNLQPTLFSNNMDLLAILLEIAERDELSSGTALFAILDYFKDVFDIPSHSFQIPEAINKHLVKLRLSSKASCRLLYLHWIHKFCQWKVEVLEAMTDLSDDLVDIVSNHAKRLFKQLREFMVTHPNQIEVIHPSLAIVLTKWDYVTYANTRPPLGIVLLISSMALSVRLQERNIGHDNPRRDILFHDMVRQVHEVHTRGPWCNISDSLQFETLKRLLHCLLSSERTSLSNENLHQVMDERWSNIDELWNDVEGDNNFDEKLIFKLNCASLLWFSMGNIKRMNPVYDLEDSFFQLLNRPEKVIRYAAMKSLSLLALTIDSTENAVEKLVSRSAYSETSTPSLSQTGSLLTLAVLSTDTSLSLENDEIFRAYASKLLSPTNDFESMDNVEKLTVMEVLEAVGILAFYRPSMSVVNQLIGLMKCWSTDCDAMLKLPSNLLSPLLVAIARVSWHDCHSAINFSTVILGKRFVSKCSRVVAFTIGGICGSIAIHHQAQTEGVVSLYLEVLKILDNLVESCEVTTKANYNVIALSIFFEIRQVCFRVPFHLFERSLYIGLNYLRQSDVFAQDICSLHLSYLYEFSFSAQTEPVYSEIEGLKKFGCLGDFLAHELAMTITKKKRPLQPAGFNSGGPSGSNISGEGNEDNGATQVPRIEVNIPTTPDRDEVLEAAAAIAAAQLNATLEGVNRRESQQEGTNGVEGYGAYAKVCAIARKSGDSGVVMQAIQLVRCDVTFGIGDSTLVFLKYRHPKVSIPESRIPALIAMLYVAKFDPIPSVREIMKAVWLSIVGVQESMWVNKHSREILEYASSNLLNPYWREREAACLSLEALLNHQSWEILKGYMADLLTKGLKVMDDLRESTRKVAVILMKILLQHVLRAINPAESLESTCKEGLDMLLPILLDKGLVSASIEARGFSLGTLIKVIETSKSMIVPWIGKLIDILIESISALEPQLLNYIQFHTTTVQVGTEEWEKARVELSKNSPMHEALRNCLQLVPLELLPSISNIAYYHLQSGVGLATKVAAADAISYLAERFPSGMGAYGGKALKAICSILLERPYLEITLRKAMLNTLGMLSKVVHETILTDECDELLNKYFLLLHDRTSDHELSVSNCIQHIIQRAGERIKESYTWMEILTASFIGSFEDDKSAAHSWSETFTSALDSSGVGTRSAAIHKCLPAMAMILPRMLLHPSWDKRKQVARIIQEMMSFLNVHELDETFGLVICSLLLTLPGALWTGQDRMLECLGDILPRLSNTRLSNVVADGDIVFEMELDDKHIVLTSPVMFLLNSSQDMEEIRRIQRIIDEYLSNRRREQPLRKIAFPRWTLFSRVLFKVFLRELQRGDSEYKINCANAIAHLPWKSMATQDNQLLLTILPSVLDVVDLFPNKTINNNLDNTQSAISTPKPVVNQKAKNMATFMFGNRYGALPTGMSRQRGGGTDTKSTARNSINTSTVAPSSNSNIHVASDVTSSIPSNESDETFENKDSKIDQQVAQSASNATPTVAPAETTKISIPAVRMYFLESLTSICNVETPGAYSSSEELINYRHITLPNILTAIDLVFQSEVWSIKRGMLQFVASLTANEGLDTEGIKRIVHIALMASEESKFVKVKVAALETFETLLSSRYRQLTKENFIETIRTVVRTASLDTQPSVLETVSRIQNVLLSL